MSNLCKAGRKLFKADEYAPLGSQISKYQKVAEELNCRFLVWNGNVYYRTSVGVWEDTGLDLCEFEVDS